ncbi:MAG: hypothetical protein IJY82_01465 [Oscillospiraceae bacterium]|nr:hypothetical protein [Oscillospiraceae bacterium]
MTLSQISEKLAETCKSNESINLLATLPEEFFYNSLDLCIIDAVFSIGVKYEGVKNVVRKYQKHLEHAHPALSKRSRTTSEAISVFESYSSILDFAKDVLNLQRTSTKNGILKAEAVLEVLKVLDKHDIQDVNHFRNLDSTKQEEVDKEILAVKGQGSGIMLKYLYMLVGNDDVCKPDRMLHRFITNISGRKMLDDELQRVMANACEILSKEYPTLTVRTLDNQIWQYQKNQVVSN